MFEFFKKLFKKNKDSSCCGCSGEAKVEETKTEDVKVEEPKVEDTKVEEANTEEKI